MKKVLVVDDEFDISEAVSAILESEGYAVEVCSNGKEAVDRLRADNYVPDLVILDVMMPFLNGYDVLREIRGCERTRDTPVILMSAVDPAPRRDELRWNEFLKKPFTLDGLLEPVMKWAGLPDGAS